MTREEATDVLKAMKHTIELYNSLSGTQTFVIFPTALDMAIESLSAEAEWIPCSERLPEEDTDVLISYRYKEGEGDISHGYIDITTYGQMYFGGRAVAGVKHWRSPFEYFNSNYEVIAWMPLPKPYDERREP